MPDWSLARRRRKRRTGRNHLMDRQKKKGSRL